MVVAHGCAVGPAAGAEELDGLVARALAALEQHCGSLAAERGEAVSHRGEVHLATSSSEHRTRVVAWCELRFAPPPEPAP